MDYVTSGSTTPTSQTGVRALVDRLVRFDGPPDQFLRGFSRRRSLVYVGRHRGVRQHQAIEQLPAKRRGGGKDQFHGASVKYKTIKW